MSGNTAQQRLFLLHAVHASAFVLRDDFGNVSIFRLSVVQLVSTGSLILPVDSFKGGDHFNVTILSRVWSLRMR